MGSGDFDLGVYRTKGNTLYQSLKPLAHKISEPLKHKVSDQEHAGFLGEFGGRGFRIGEAEAGGVALQALTL